MDEIDIRILDSLRKNSRNSFLQLAKKLKVSEGTIRKRVKNMLQKNVIKRFTIEESYDTSAVVEVVTTAQISTDRIVTDVKKIKGVQNTLEVAGRFTILCMVKTSNLESINEIVEKIRQVKGVLQTETFPVLRQG